MLGWTDLIMLGWMDLIISGLLWDVMIMSGAPRKICILPRVHNIVGGRVSYFSIPCTNAEREAYDAIPVYVRFLSHITLTLYVNNTCETRPQVYR